MSLYTNNNLIRIDKNNVSVFDTTLRMPHIVDYVYEGNWIIPSMPITISGTSYTANSSQNYYKKTSSSFTAANSFVFAYIKVRNNSNRTEIDTNNPIFVSGSLLMRLYIENNGYRGAMIITPRAWDNYIGFNVEHTYNFTRSSDPPHLYLNAARNACDPQVSIDYSIYYGRYI